MNVKALIAPAIVSILILLAFGGLSLIAMKPGIIGDANKDVLLMLFGQWSSLAALAASYWLGSSNSSAKKDETIQRKDDTIQNMANKS
jgi:hypothetical protein